MYNSHQNNHCTSRPVEKNSGAACVASDQHGRSKRGAIPDMVKNIRTQSIDAPVCRAVRRHHKQHKTGAVAMKKDNRVNVDIALSVLCSISKQGESLSSIELADMCDCSTGYIQSIERKAIKKLRNKARHYGINDYAPGQQQCNGISQ
jgi:hypothetical protein